MVTGRDAEDLTNLNEVVIAQSFELDALINVLQHKGLLTRGEVMEEVQRLVDKAAKGH